MTIITYIVAGAVTFSFGFLCGAAWVAITYEGDDQ
jgi:hypothetical protein